MHDWLRVIGYVCEYLYVRSPHSLTANLKILFIGYTIIPEHEISRQSTGRTTAPSPANTLAGDSQQAAQLSPGAATPAVCRATERTAYGTLVLYSHKRSANISCSGKATVKREDGPWGRAARSA